MPSEAASAVLEQLEQTEALPSIAELQARIRKSVDTIAKERDPISDLFPAATAEHCDRDRVYHHFWVRDGAIIALKLLDVKDGEEGKKARENAQKGLQGMFRLFKQKDFVDGFEQPVTEIHGHTHIDTQKTPPVHRNLDGTDFYWHGRNQPDSFGEFLMAVAKAKKEDVQVGNNEFLSREQHTTLRQVAEYLLRLQIWKFEFTSMWENETVYNPHPISTVAIVAKGLQDIRSLLPEYASKIDAYVATCHKYIENEWQPYNKDYPNRFREKTELHHPRKFDMATLVAFNLGALDFLGEQVYLDWREEAYQHEELGYEGIEGGMRRFNGDKYYARLKDGTINVEPIDVRDHIAHDGEAVWFMAIPMDGEMLARIIPKLSRSKPSDAQKLEKELIKRVNYIQRLYKECGNMFPELFTPTYDGSPPKMNDNDLLWNHAVVIGAMSQVIKLFATPFSYN